MDVVRSKAVVVGHKGEATGGGGYIFFHKSSSLKLTFEFHSRWVHLGASQTIATLAQTHPRSNCHNGLYCDALRREQLHISEFG